jgi:Tol biopolymer transport system component
MGEVYRATDTTLNREVAIKVLPPEVAQDRERLGRFRREAQLLASLNHPNIAAIYGLEEAEGKPFLALELVEGEDLKERLGRGAIAVDEAVEIAKQIAEALEEAHNNGIVHRDLKPANVKLTPDGKVKVLDFGLAKAWSGDTADGSSSSAALSQSPTLANTGTVAGVILGTAAYMSPEQARGKPVDKRADIWSFGVLAWEMLTGKTLFTGDTVTDVIAAVVTREPELKELPKATPRAVRRLVARCLRKDPRTRLPDVGAARLELHEVITGTADETGTEADGVVAAAPGDWWARLSGARIAVAFVAGALAALGGVLGLTPTPEERGAVHFAFEPPEGGSFGEFDPPAASPNGRRVAFRALSSEGTSMIWLRSMDSPVARPLSGTEGGRGPIWSPEGESLAFVAEGELRKITLASGTVQRICTLPERGYGAGAWSQDDVILFSTGAVSARLYTVPASGGEAKALTTHDAAREETAHWWPRLLPDGQHFLFVIASRKDDAVGLHVASLDAPDERRRLLPTSVRAEYESGQLLFVQSGTLLAQPFDAGRAELTGEPVAVASSVAAWSGFGGWGRFTASAGGVLVYQEGEASPNSELAWFDRKGVRLATVGKPGQYGQIALSPDESHVAVELTADEGGSDIWTIDLARGVATRLTFDPAVDIDPVWSRDGRELIFSSPREGPFRLYRKALQGNEPVSPLAETLDDVFPEGWSVDGQALVYVMGAGEAQTVGVLPSDGDGEPEPILEKDFPIDEPQVSPDGRWLAYVSQESGQWEVYVEAFRRVGTRVRVSPEGGGQPRWRGDGKELFYVSPDGRLMAVEVRTGEAGLEVSLPALLFEFEAGVADPIRDEYAVTADGQRFLVRTPVEEEEKQRLHVLLDWTSLLE